MIYIFQQLRKNYYVEGWMYYFGINRWMLQTVSMWCFFIYFFSYNFNVIVDRMIGASRHSKVIVDGINTSKKRCRMEGNE